MFLVTLFWTIGIIITICIVGDIVETFWTIGIIIVCHLWMMEKYKNEFYKHNGSYREFPKTHVPEPERSRNRTEEVGTVLGSTFF